MTHRLVTFLGKGHYRRVAYAFARDPRTRTNGWFLAALLEHLSGRPVDRPQPVDVVTVVGVPGSCWYELIDLRFGNSLDAELRALRNKLRRPAPDEQAVDELAAGLNRDDHQPRMELKLVEDPLAADGDQVVLRRIADGLKQGDRVTLDVTHSFRHLPMLGLLAALYLRRVREVEIGGIYYAALDADEDDEGGVEVVDLRRLVDLADWIVALGRFDASGDAGVFVDLLEADGNPNEALDALREGAALERATRTEAAAAAVRAGQAGLDQTPERALALSGTGAFFADELQRALAWANEGTAFDQQRHLARRHLQHHDWLRAAILMFEACVLRLVEKARPPGGVAPDWRKAVPNYLCGNPTMFSHVRTAEPDRFDRRKERFRLLKDVRNALAHADEAKTPAAAEIVESPERVRQELEQLYDELLSQPDAFP